MNFRKRFTLTTLTLASGLALAACGQNGTNADDVVASGNNVEVTYDELVEEMKAISGNQVLQQLILTDMFEDAVGEDRIKELKTEAETDTALLIAQYGGEDAFGSVLESAGYTKKEDYQESLYYYKLMSEAVSSKIKISDKEIQTAYDKYEPAIEASHILVETKKEAEDIIKQLNDGGDFAKLAKEHSKDSTAEAGGSLGPVSKGQMVKEFEDAAFALEAGKYTTKPVESEFGFHVILVTKKPKKGTLEEEKEQLTETLRQEKLNDSAAVQNIVSDMLKSYNIKINDKDLEGALDAFKPEENPEKETSAESKTSSAAAETSSSKENSSEASSKASSESEAKASESSKASSESAAE